MVQEGVTDPTARALAASKVAGAARFLADRAAFWVTGRHPGGKRGVRTVRTSTDPMDSTTAHAIRDVFTTCAVMADLTGAIVGPRITRYEIRKHKGQSVEKILKLQRELEYAVGSPNVTMISPIPGKSAIGIEVPREQFDAIKLTDIVIRNPHPLMAAIGKDIEGNSIVANLADMPHLLIAGTTGAGKSSCLNSILVSIIGRATPDQVRMILIDPKRVEFMPYEELPHLLMPVVTEAKKAIPALEWCISDMEARYEKLVAARVRNIDEYNAKHPGEPMYYTLVVVDELADLMMVAEKEIEDLIVRIAQKARACGIHLVLATQKPVVKVVTGLIKGNVPSRLAFAVADGVDSDTILDRRGAEKLLGKGDGLFLPLGAMFPVRIQGPLVADSEIQAAVTAAQTGQTAVHVPVQETPIEVDPHMDRARSLIVDSRNGSASMLQRTLKISFGRANEILAELEREGIVGPARVGKPRVVLVKGDKS